jgi:hypothetical protein
MMEVALAAGRLKDPTNQPSAHDGAETSQCGTVRLQLLQKGRRSLVCCEIYNCSLAEALVAGVKS